MQHLLNIEQLSSTEVVNLIETANHFKRNKNYPSYSDALITLFYENSTRTRISFELAAQHLSLKVSNFNLNTSSESKGETIEDTFQTLKAMGFKYFVIRHSHNHLPKSLSIKFGQDVHIINAGDGQNAHPTQALLDLMTIVEHKPNLSRLKVAVIGDLRHSRVVNSFQGICKLMGIGELVLVGPKMWHPEKVQYGDLTTSLREGLSDADVVMCLRVQKERLENNEHYDLSAYQEQFSITLSTLKWAKSDAILLHPGPINRGVEIDSLVADGPQSVLLQQVKNGVYMRMAILNAMASE